MNLQPVAISPPLTVEQKPDFLDNYTKKYGLYANDFIVTERQRSNDRISMAMRENLLRLKQEEESLKIKIS